MTNRQENFIEHYCTDAKFNASEAYKKAYPNTKNGWNAHGARLIAKDSIKQAITKKKAELSKIIKHNYEKAVEMIEERIGWLNTKAKTGNVQAIQAQTALIRELDDITGLKQQNINITTEQQRELDEKESQEAKRVAKILNMQELKEA